MTGSADVLVALFGAQTSNYLVSMRSDSEENTYKETILRLLIGRVVSTLCHRVLWIGIRFLSSMTKHYCRWNDLTTSVSDGAIVDPGLRQGRLRRRESVVCYRRCRIPYVLIEQDIARRLRWRVLCITKVDSLRGNREDKRRRSKKTTHHGRANRSAKECRTGDRAVETARERLVLPGEGLNRRQPW